MFFLKNKQDKLIELSAAISVIAESATEEQMDLFVGSLFGSELDIANKFIMARNRLRTGWIIENGKPGSKRTDDRCNCRNYSYYPEAI